MRTFLTRILAALTVAAFSVGPVSAATAANAGTWIAQAANQATVQGTVHDDTGAPLAGAQIELRGPQTYTTKSDATGAFSISGIQPGIYAFSAQKPGYETATETDFVLAAGQTQTVAIRIHAQTFTSLRTIATVQSEGRAQFNTSTASVEVVPATTFLNQAQPTVNRVLNQIPGVQNTLPTSSANGAVAGAITVPNIRGGLSFETASLIDGHPLAVGDYGDFVTTFLNSFMFSSVEVIKGSGAMVPETNYAINGTINFRTKDPTETATPDYTIGVDNQGGSFYNAGISDTIGRLGFVVDISGINEPSALDGHTTYFQTYGNNGVADWNGATGTVVSNGYTYIPSSSTSAPYNPGTLSRENSVYGLLACCYTYGPNFNNTSELFKFRYKFSGATTATVSYLGFQSFADQNENTGSEAIPSVFSPSTIASTYYNTGTTGASYGSAASAYTGGLKDGTAMDVPNAVYPNTAQEIDNEPMFQAEVRTLVGDDTVLARYYHASIDRLIYEGNPNPAIPVIGDYKLYGVNPASNKSCALTTCPAEVFNGQMTPMAFFDWYNQWEEDRLTGLSFEYDHGYGAGDDVMFSVDQTNASSAAGSQSAAYPSVATGTNTYLAPASAAGYLQTPSVSNPQGTSQLFTTFLLRNIYNISPKLSSTVALYDNLYNNYFPFECVTSKGAPTSSCAINGSNAYFTSNHNSHFDERFALEFRPTNSIAIRASAGSSIAPPYLSLLSKVSTNPTCSTSTGTCTFSVNNPNLLPETAFGYDLGADFRVPFQTVVSVDGYFTNLFNRYLGMTFQTPNCGVLPGAKCTAGDPIFESLNTNLNNSRYEGIELDIHRTVTQGLGFVVQGAVQHAYAYNLPADFYCAGLPAGVGCIPANYNTNLAIIAGENFTGNTFGTYLKKYVCSCPSNGKTFTASAGGFSNTAIPYLQGNAEINYTTANGIYAAFGDTLYGKNNGNNVPPFGIAYATIRVPINKTVSFQVSGDNVLNAYTNLYPTIGGGVAYPLADGAQGATIANTVGPATYTFELTKTLP